MANKIRAVWAHHAFNELKRRKVDTYAALQRAELSQLSLMDPEQWIPFDKEVRFFEAAAKLSGDDCFGVHLGARIDPRTAGLIAYIGLAAKTLDDAFRNFTHYLKVHNAALRTAIIDDGPHVRLVTELNQPELYQYVQRSEFGASLILHVTRWLTQRDVCFHETHLVHSREQYCHEVQRVLDCRVLFDQQRDEIVFHRDDMTVPLPTADDHLLTVLCKNADQLLQERSEQNDDFMHAVIEMIIDHLSSGQATAKKIAHQLGTSERTLSRRLAEHGTSFDNLIDDVRQELALSYLDEGDIKLQDLAFLLGYSTHASFSAAVKRWTGRTPSELRAKA